MKGLLSLQLLAAASALAAEPAAKAGRVVHADDFNGNLSQWAVEQQPAGTVTTFNGRLIITDHAGCTVWFRPRLTAPVVVSYDAKICSPYRVSDLNCFWMATEPKQPNAAPYAKGHARDGRFAAYDSLRTYYVGYGGNANTTTRFRRYDGHGARPLRPEHDLSHPKFLLTANHTYHITLIVTADGRVQWLRDGEVVFDFRDPEPLKSGWFAFRTVNSRIEITHFRVFSGRDEEEASREHGPGPNR